MAQDSKFIGPFKPPIQPPAREPSPFVADNPPSAEAVVDEALDPFVRPPHMPVEVVNPFAPPSEERITAERTATERLANIEKQRIVRERTDKYSRAIGVIDKDRNGEISEGEISVASKLLEDKGFFEGMNLLGVPGNIDRMAEILLGSGERPVEGERSGPSSAVRAPGHAVGRDRMLPD